VANFYPVQWLASRIGGDRVHVTTLTPAGTEPHDLTLDAAGQRALASAKVVFYLGAGFQPDVEKAIGDLPPATVTSDLLSAPGVSLLDAPPAMGKESLKGGKDPHVWLDPVLMKQLAASIEKTLAGAATQNAATFATNLEALERDLDALDTTLKKDLTGCRNKAVVTSHAAFQYLTHRYGLTQLPIAGISPEDEPTATTLRQIAQTAAAAGVTTVFFEDALSADLSRTVANEIGAEIDLLSALEFDPSESIDGAQNYLSVMTANSARLGKGLTCG
jgi:zinc transport system substrate-binding protein